ncbi:MAG: glycosyltransferase family 2 protein [Candidatus Nitrosopumilus sp. bin_6a]
MTEQNSQEITITIGIPVYNGTKFLSEKISSIINQDFSDFELVISDNGSTDSTREICEKFASKDERIRFFSHEKNMGPNWNFNFILEKARGRYFMWTSVDDKILPGFIEKNISVLEKRENVVCSISQVKPYGEKTKYLNDEKRDKSLGKIKKKLIRKFTPMKNYSTSGTLDKKIRLYLKLRGHQQVFYGIFRTRQLREFFVSNFVTGFDLATMLNALKYGDFFVLDEVLNYRYDGGTSSSGLFNYSKSFKLSFFDSIFLYYPLIKWCWKSLGVKIFFKNFDCMMKFNFEVIFYLIVDIIRKIGLGNLVNPKKIE